MSEPDQELFPEGRVKAAALEWAGGYPERGGTPPPPEQSPERGELGQKRAIYLNPFSIKISKMKPDGTGYLITKLDGVYVLCQLSGAYCVTLTLAPSTRQSPFITEPFWVLFHIEPWKY